MKLLPKTSLYFLIASIPVLLLSGIACYSIITSEVRESNNELLLKQKSQIEKYLQNKDVVSLQMITQNGNASITPISGTRTANIVFSDTMIVDNKENESAPNRLLTAGVTINGGHYLIKVWRSTLEYQELFEGIITALLIILFLFFIIFLMINWWVNRTLWKPFYQTVEALQSFRVSTQEKPVLQPAFVKEFKELNSSINGMMDKMISDFKSQKQFTENAAHEMQTPLAVIKTKIDLLIQSDKLQKNEIDLILSIDDASSKLARLNKSLLLLAKIENRQFKTDNNVEINKVIEDSLQLFEEHIELKSLTVTTSMSSDVLLNMNVDLCFVLINNLIQNAIRHNKENGEIEITLTKQQLIITNTGQQKPLGIDVLFERFHKNSSSPDSLGLGLAIANEIAEASEMSLNYHYKLHKHHFILRFSS